MIERGVKTVENQSPLGLLFQLLEPEPPPDAPPPTEGNKVSPGRPRGRSKPRQIPVIGWAHAGEAGTYDEIPHSWVEEIPTECRDDKAFGLRLEGDSMESSDGGLSFREGDLIVAMPSSRPYSGCFVVAKFMSDGVTFRRLETRGSRIVLAPLNKRYDVTDHAEEEFAWIYPVWGRWTQLWNR